MLLLRGTCPGPAFVLRALDANQLAGRMFANPLPVLLELADLLVLTEEQVSSSFLV